MQSLTWKQILQPIWQSDELKSICIKIKEQEENEFTIFLPEDQRLNAFLLTSFNDTKVIIIGQNSYINNSQSNGLAFSVNKNMIIPPSLRNSF